MLVDVLTLGEELTLDEVAVMRKKTPQPSPAWVLFDSLLIGRPRIVNGGGRGLIASAASYTRHTGKRVRVLKLNDGRFVAVREAEAV